jgi:hypothetical protein
VIVPAAVLAGLSDQPAHLAGYGPITAQAARELASSDATWYRILTDPAGHVADISTAAHDPPAALAAYVRARDGTCRFPGCRAPAWKCDLDHTVAYPNGPTCAANLTDTCRRHHLLRHASKWTYTLDPDGKTHWRSPTGRTYETEPARYPDGTPEEGTI